jgi:ketosteroid isomerase-like protein
MIRHHGDELDHRRESCPAKLQNFSTELMHPSLRIRLKADLCPLADCGGLVVLNKCTLLLFCVLAASPSFCSQRANIRPTTGFNAGDEETIREIVDLERQTKEATLHRDADFPMRTLADDYVAITPLGQVTSKQDAISARRSGQLRYESMNITEMVVRLFGDTAVVTARAEVKGHQLGEDFSGPYRYTRVWVRRNGHWQTVSYQATVTQ